MPNPATKSARLDTRIPPELHAGLRRAAEMQGRTLSDYVTATLQEAVRRDIAETTTIRLSREASEAFAAALLDPPAPNEALRRAFEHRRRLLRPE